MRFNLTRYYALASLLCIVLAATILGALYRQLSEQSLMRMAEDRNATITHVFGNAMWPYLDSLLHARRAETSNEASARAVAEIDAALRQLTRETLVVKVKVYDLSGVTVYSTERSQIGQSKLDNPGFRAAAAGRNESELTFRDHMSAFDEVIENRDVLSSYVPFRGPGNERVEGVFELYYDVTPLLADVKRAQWQVAGAVAAVLIVLYALLYFVVGRAERIIGRQEAELKTYLARIEQANQLLDQRVRERTAELEQANHALLGEVAERKRAEAQLRLWANVFRNALEGVMITDPATRVVAVNQAFSDITGYAEAEVIGCTPRMLQSGRHDQSFYREMWLALQATGRWVGEIWNRRKSGERYPQRLTISTVKDESGAIVNYVGVFSDISDIKRSQERLDFLAHHDLLTSLPNRLLFNERVADAIVRAKRRGGMLALLFLDLDQFKHVNDTLGHEFGDQVLTSVAAALSVTMREGDTLARVGGDEFVLLLESIPDASAAVTAAERILAVLGGPMTVAGNEVFVTASVGVSIYPRDGEDVSALVKNADTAMYYAKTHGRNVCYCYAAEMSAYARERVRLESLLRFALDRDELLLHYQPLVDLATERIVGVEALLRWRNPELGLVSPARFIPAAEDNGFICTMGEWVLRTACAQMKAWDAAGFVVPKMAVNVSMKQLERGNIVDTVAYALEQTGLEPSRLELEVTESAIMQSARAVEYLDRLRALGVEIAVDDFGTGYSSLSYLQRLPVHKLKIDRSFITGVASDPGRGAIVRAIIALGAALRLRTVAEGVETRAEADFLRKENCVHGQGFLYGKPIPADELVARWREGQGNSHRRLAAATELAAQGA